jgi:hypothetical protein
MSNLQIAGRPINLSDQLISPLFISPAISPVEFITDRDSIVIPSLLKFNTVTPYKVPYNESSLVLSPNDIYVPSFNVVRDVASLYSPLYEDVCATPSIKEKVSKIFYYKMLDKWLYDESKYLLKYLKVSDGKVNLIKNLTDVDDYDTNSQEIVDKKVQFIEDNIFKLENVFEILKKFIASTNISWCELTTNSYFVREAIEKTLKHKFKKLITSKK